MKKIISTVLICILLLGCILALASCGVPSSDPKEAKAALEEEGYTVELRENNNGCVATIYAYYNNVKEKKFDEIEIFYYKDEAAAQKAWETKEKSYEDEKESKKDTDFKIQYGIKETVIYKGTVDAVKAAK